MLVGRLPLAPSLLDVFETLFDDGRRVFLRRDAPAVMLGGHSEHFPFTGRTAFDDEVFTGDFVAWLLTVHSAVRVLRRPAP